MKFAPLVLKHLRKNWIRTLSTVLAMSVCIFLICVLQTVIAAVNFGLNAGSTRRLVVRDYVSLANNLPISYKQKIAAIPGVTDTDHRFLVWRNSTAIPRTFFANLAVEPEAFLRIYPEVMLPPDQKAAWLSDVRGAIIGRKLAQRFGWKIGDHVQLESFIPPYRVGKPFDFVVDGIYDTDEARYPGTDLNSMYFNFKYLYEATGQRVGIGTLTAQIDDPSHAGAMSKAIDETFDNSDNPTKTETEQAFRAGFVALAGNLALLLNVIGMAVAFTILLVTANTMSIAVRERQQEIAVLKTLGFLQRPGHDAHPERGAVAGADGRTAGHSVRPGNHCCAGERAVPGRHTARLPFAWACRRRSRRWALAWRCCWDCWLASSPQFWRIARASPKH